MLVMARDGPHLARRPGDRESETLRDIDMYIGPETLMPLASALAAIAGVLMLFWRKTVTVFRACVGFVSQSFSRLLGRS